MKIAKKRAANEAAHIARHDKATTPDDDDALVDDQSTSTDTNESRRGDQP
jgi:hypothetical protein